MTYTVSSGTLNSTIPYHSIPSGLAGFIGAKDDGGGADNWSYKSCKAPLRSTPPTNQYPTF